MWTISRLWPYSVPDSRKINLANAACPGVVVGAFGVPGGACNEELGLHGTLICIDSYTACTNYCTWPHGSPLTSYFKCSNN